MTEKEKPKKEDYNMPENESALKSIVVFLFKLLERDDQAEILHLLLQLYGLSVPGLVFSAPKDEYFLRSDLDVTSVRYVRGVLDGGITEQKHKKPKIELPNPVKITPVKKHPDVVFSEWLERVGTSWQQGMELVYGKTVTAAEVAGSSVPKHSSEMGPGLSF